MSTADAPSASPGAGGFADWALAALPDGVWVIDDDGVTTYGNPALADMLGLDPDELIGFRAVDALDEQGRIDFGQHLAERSRTGAAGHNLEVCIYRSDGSSFWALVSHVPLVDDRGTFRGWMYRVKDHHDERTLYEQRAQGEEQLAEAQAIAGVGSWERDVPSDTTVWSDEAYRLCGVDPAQPPPSAEEFFDLLDPADRDLVEEAYDAMVNGADVLDVEARMRAASGPGVCLRIRGRVVRDEAGEMLRMRGTLQDVTTVKNNEQGLQFLTAFGSAANEAGTLLEVLAAAEDEVRTHAPWPAVLIAFPEPDAVDPTTLSFIDMTWTHVDDSVRAFARELAREAAGRRRPIQRTGPDGDLLIAGRAYVARRLACVVVCSAKQPIEAKAVDLAVFEQMLTLLAHVAEREWAADELEAARDAALSASRAKSEFLATMSHEIRTPLNGVIGLSELLRRSELSPHQMRLTDGVDQAGRTLLALVNDILDLSKIEAGHLDLELVDFDPRTIVEQSAGLVADRAREKGLELVVSSAADLPTTVRGDPVRFGQVIINLAANAVKFTESGEVVIRADRQGSQVRVSVRDTGVGIEPAAQLTLFDPFTQADSSTTRQYGGTGLGLAICHRIVTAMEGDIGVESEPGVGSTFWFTTTFAPALREISSRTEQLKAKAVAGLRVLVVDDNTTNRFILTEQLSGWSVDVTAVESAYEALVEIDASVRRGSPFDVVLLDYMMPGADGEQLARIVRAEKRHDRTRLVLLSSSSGHDWLEDAGIDRYLTKPVLPSHLLEVLATLGGRWAESADDGQVETPDLVGEEGAAPADGERGRILVVEDNAINQLVAEGVLRRLGFAVQMADNGAAGVAAVADDPEGFDAILMDCQMPVMDGFDATRAVRAIQRGGARTPIIAMTAAAVAEERERCLTAGMDDFLTKPVDVRLLAQMLDRWAPPEVRGPSADVVEAPAEAPTALDDSDTSASDAAASTARLAALVDDEGIDLTLVARMVERFEATATDVLASLRRAVTAGSTSATEQHTHSLSGSAANLGLTRVARTCSRFEQDAREGRLPAATDLAALGRDVERGAADLRDFVRARMSG